MIKIIWYVFHTQVKAEILLAVENGQFTLFTSDYLSRVAAAGVIFIR